MAHALSELRERLLRAGVGPRHVGRYLRELSDHLADLIVEERRSGRTLTEAEAAALARLGGIDELTEAMTSRPEFRGWCARTPWVMFGVLPLGLLSIAYGVAGLIAWSIWKLYLPGTDTPFGHPVHGLGVILVAAGKFDYLGTPVALGWMIGILAARQRSTPLWPAVGIAATALVGGISRFYGIRSPVPGGVGHIGVAFSLGPSVEGVPYGVLHILVILMLSGLPYLAWLLRQSFRPSR